MDPTILGRALLAVGIAAAGMGLYYLVNRILLARVQGKRLGLESIQPGIPAILYFTTPGCVPCKTVQRPALGRLKERLDGGVQIIEVDASDQPELAAYWGVLSVPTTFIIDGRGQPRRVNHGVTSAEKLERQILEVENKKRSRLEDSLFSLKRDSLIW